MNRVILATGLGVCVLVTGYVMSPAAPTPAPLAPEFLPVENAPVFATMGADIWKIRFPAKLLTDKHQFVLKMTTAKRAAGGRLTEVAKPRPLLELPIRQKPGVERPVDLTIVIYRDNPNLAEAKTVHFAISTDDSYQRTAKGNPIPGCDAFGRPNQLGDFNVGVDLATFSSSKTNDWVGYSLWIE